MKLDHRRQFLNLAASTAALSVVPRIARAQAYPTKPVRIVVGFAAGGPASIFARLIGQWLSEHLSQPFVIENRAGAASNIGTEAVVRAPPDGYTLLLASSVNVINTSLYQKLNFDFVRDTAPIAGVIRMPHVMVVNPSFPATTVPKFISYARENPGKINFGSGGTGTVLHVSGELMNMMAGVNMIHVPYRGAGPALTDLIGGQVQVVFDLLPSSLEHIRTGRLRALAVTTETRSEELPDVPTIGEFLPGYETSTFYGIVSPRRVSAEIIYNLNKEIDAGLADNGMKARFADLGGTPLSGTPADFGMLIAAETDKWAKVVKFAGIKVE